MPVSFVVDHLSYRDIVAQSLRSGKKVIHILGAPPHYIISFNAFTDRGALLLSQRLSLSLLFPGLTVLSSLSYQSPSQRLQSQPVRSHPHPKGLTFTDRENEYLRERTRGPVDPRTATTVTAQRVLPGATRGASRTRSSISALE